MNLQKVYGLIPARLESSRLPGKALKLIKGLPMVVHVAKRSALCSGIDMVAVCTDSRQIAQTCAQFGINVVLTSNSHRNGTERVAEAASVLELNENDIVLDIQGDEALVNPKSLQKVIDFHKCNDFEIVVPYISISGTGNQNRVKIVEAGGRVLYMSRADVPHPFTQSVKLKKHLSTVAFSIASLKKFIGFEPSSLEKTESIELLRAIESGMSVGTFCETSDTLAVDTEEDLEKVRRLILSDQYFHRY